MARVLTVFIFLGLAASVAAGPDPEWIRADCAGRVVFAVPRGAESVRVRFPVERGLTRDSTFAAYDGAGWALPSRFEDLNGNNAVVHVRMGEGRGARMGVLYFNPEPAAEGNPGGEAEPDAEPINVDVYRATSRKQPTTWPRLLYMLGKAGDPIRRLHTDGVQSLDLTRAAEDEEKRKQQRSERYVVTARTLLRCPRDGVYRFGLHSHAISFLLVNRDPVAQALQPDTHADWEPGRPMFLEKGLHLVEIYSHSGHQYLSRLGWQTPGSEALVRVPPDALVGGRDATDYRVEWKDRSLHAALSASAQTAYAFRGHPVQFIPVRFTNRSADWVSDSLLCRWRFGDGREAEGADVTHIYTRSGRYEAVLDVRDALGFQASCRRDVDLRLVQATELALGCALQGVPPVSYGGESVSPFLRFRGVQEWALPFEVRWEVVSRAGAAEKGRAMVSHQAGWTDVALPSFSAGQTATLTWEVRHEAIPVWAGAVHFERPPFNAVPARIEGDGLVDRHGNRLVLVPHRYGGDFRQARIETQQAFGRLLCVDDFLAVPGLGGGNGGTPYHPVLARIVDGPDRPIVDHVALPAWDSAEGAFGPLLNLVKVRAALHDDTDVVIASVGLQDMLGGRPVESFERMAAALSDLVSATLGRPMIWVTLPPYAAAEDRAREFSAAVRRVADARGMPVADVYSAFRGRPDRAALFERSHDLALAPRGQQLVAQLIARALLRE